MQIPGNLLFLGCNCCNNKKIFIEPPRPIDSTLAATRIPKGEEISAISGICKVKKNICIFASGIKQRQICDRYIKKHARTWKDNENAYMTISDLELPARKHSVLVVNKMSNYLPLHPGVAHCEVAFIS